MVGPPFCWQKFSTSAGSYDGGLLDWPDPSVRIKARRTFSTCCCKLGSAAGVPELDGRVGDAVVVELSWTKHANKRTALFAVKKNYFCFTLSRTNAHEHARTHTRTHTHTHTHTRTRTRARARARLSQCNLLSMAKSFHCCPVST